MTKSQKNLRNFTLAGALALSVATISGIASPATSAPGHDGLWSVVIVTERGTCDRAYRYPVRISNGSVGYAGEASFNVTGRVGANGAVTVTVSRGSQSATGTGRMSSSDGVGHWATSGGECSGTWSAEKRS